MICHDTARGVGSFLRVIKKNGLAANNGDTLGEAVISVKSNEFRSERQEKFQLKTTKRKTVLHHHHLSFQRSFKRCKPITVLKISKP
jgi:hypothetical protein